MMKSAHTSTQPAAIARGRDAAQRMTRQTRKPATRIAGMRPALLVGLLLMAFAPQAAAQQFDDDRAGRNVVSMSVHGGVTHPFDGTRSLIRSNFNAGLDYSLNVGGEIQYLLTPTTSMGLQYNYADLQGTGNTFETELLSVGLATVFTFEQFPTGRLAPQLSLGAGVDLYNYISPNTELTRQDPYARAGLGFQYELSPSVDFYVRHAFHLGSNRLDNIQEGFPTNMVTMTSGGIRFYIGDRQAFRERSRPLTRAEELPGQDEMARIEQRLAAMESRMQEEQAGANELAELRRSHRQLAERFEQEAGQVDSLAAQYAATLETVQTELDRLREQLTGGGVNSDYRINSEEVPDGFYVQVFASEGEQGADNQRREAARVLENEIDVPQARVYIMDFGDLYRVRIGPLESLARAQQVQSRLVEHFEGAFITR